MMTGPTFTLDPEVTRLMAEAAEWRLLGLLFEYPDGEWRHQLSAVAPDLKDARLRGLAEAALADASEGIHLALFGPGGKVSVREVTYRGGVQLGYLMSELAAYYEAFNYQPATAEVDDHVSVLAGFVAYLRMKQAFAVASGEAEHAAVASEAAEGFIREHLATLAQPVATALEALAPEYLAEAGRILFQQAGTVPRSGYPLDSLIEEGDDSDEMACGSAPGRGELIQLEP